MFRLPIIALVAGLVFGAGTVCAAPAPAPDLFTVTGIKVDETAESATSARDLAMTQGRPLAWTKLYRRLTASANWSKQPQPDANALLRMVRSFEVANERRSSTRYLAEVTYHFNPAAVRALLRQSGIAYTETRSRRALVIPVVTGSAGFDPASPWAIAWKDPVLQQGLVPFALPGTEPEDMEILARPDLAQADWATLAPLARRYNAAEIILAFASEDAKTVQMAEISPTARVAASFAYANSSFAADAEAVAEKAYETWKTRSAVNFGTRAQLVADVQFDSLDDWAKIRNQLGAVKAVANMDVTGLALHEAEVQLTYFGRPEQLRDALAQQNLSLANAGGQFTLQLAGKSANAQ
ncbi:MAG TPA: DUF2066 domain-containing protein [Micropepsaceae bacterium]|jgi:hypothetical protein|nr:DUF2066 domain-containing protein [Micropepsaceae bacterium]